MVIKLKKILFTLFCGLIFSPILDIACAIADPIRIEISPAPIVVMPGQTITLGAKLFNLPSNALLNWSIDSVGVGDGQRGKLSRDFQPSYTAPQIAPKRPVFVQILALINGVPVAGARSKIIFVNSGSGEKKSTLRKKGNPSSQSKPTLGDKTRLEGKSSHQGVSNQQGNLKQKDQSEKKVRSIQKEEGWQNGEVGQQRETGQDHGFIKNNQFDLKNEASQKGKSVGTEQGKVKKKPGKDIIRWTQPPPPNPNSTGEIMWNSNPSRGRSENCEVPSCRRTGPSAPPPPPPPLTPQQWN